MFSRLNKMIAVAVLLSASLLGCQTLNKDDDSNKPPQITKEMPLDEVIDAAVRFGGQTMSSAKKEISRRGQWAETSRKTRQLLDDKQDEWNTSAMINGINLYIGSAPQNPDQLFKNLVRSDKPVVRQLAWHVASVLSSDVMAKAAEEELTRLVKRGSMQGEYFPQLARAIASNGLKDSYSILREGLFVTHSDAYSEAMMAINPVQASEDFLHYLSTVPVEELRQITITSINVYTSLGILRHMLGYQASVTHPKFQHLFLYSISRNVALKNIAREVIETYVPQHKEYLAIVLARMPTWIQLAYVEGSRHRMTPVARRLLSELKRVTPEKAVVDELKSIRL